ncbi:hypothetical protein [Paramesorhizobium deserti]|uniref:hypothetical protein n=1 Tax=Paramesorhizobium deserti TaxID=1494590 RepID=UPI00137A8423|nr:hypothetical protein [Paramesorhizobium deserti]
MRRKRTSGSENRVCQPKDETAASYTTSVNARISVSTSIPAANPIIMISRIDIL